MTWLVEVAREPAASARLLGIEDAARHDKPGMQARQLVRRRRVEVGTRSASSSASRSMATSRLPGFSFSPEAAVEPQSSAIAANQVLAALAHPART